MGAVIDASTLLAALIDDGDDGRWALEQLAQKPMAAPELLPAESSNILRRLELSHEITRLEATASQRELTRFGLDLYPFGPFADRVWELRFNFTAYDAWYVALAERLDWPLVTLDRKAARASGSRCEFRVPPWPEPAA